MNAGAGAGRAGGSPGDALAPGEWTPETRELLEAALREDLGAGDLTTAATVPEALHGTARTLARERGVMAGGEVAEWIFRRVGPDLRVRRLVGDGEDFAEGDALLEVAGAVAPILTAERLALNVLQRLCGVATLTRAYVEAVAGTRARILDTRKTTPGWRELERAAVRAGGGENHRSGLWDAVLVKENHVRAAGGIAAAWQAAAESSGAAFVEIEVRDRRELAEALAVGARRVLLDNFPPSELAEAVRLARRIAPDVLLEASGGITLANVLAVAETGVDRISVGALTHSARALDLSLLLETVERTQHPEARENRGGAG